MTRLAGFGIDRRAWAVTLSRASDGAYNDDGDHIPGASTTIPIKAVVQPASGNQLLDVPEGMRVSSTPTGAQVNAGWLLWSRSEVRLNDHVFDAGVEYRVMYLWPRREGEFFRAALGRLTR